MKFVMMERHSLPGRFRALSLDLHLTKIVIILQIVIALRISGVVDGLDGSDRVSRG